MASESQVGAGFGPRLLRCDGEDGLPVGIVRRDRDIGALHLISAQVNASEQLALPANWILPAGQTLTATQFGAGGSEFSATSAYP